jgi:hypothetical protein
MGPNDYRVGSPTAKTYLVTPGSYLPQRDFETTLILSLAAVQLGP